MKKPFILVLVFISTFSSYAQKKLVPVTESALTGIALPVGTLQDKRILSVSAAGALLEMESKKTGKAVSTTEVLVLPSATAGGFDKNVLVKELSEKGWQITVFKDDNKYFWLQKGNQSVIMYFSMNTKESSLYFALDASSPQNSQVNNTIDVQTANTGNSQNQQTIDPSIQYKPVEFSVQKETFDLVSYSPPKEWKKEVNDNLISYSTTNKSDKSWCQIGIVKSTNSKGGIDQDVESEWAELAAKPYHIVDMPQKSEVSDAEGWKIQSSSGQFTFNNNKAAVILTTFSGFGRCVSIIATTGNQRYLDDIESFISHIELKKPGEIQEVKEEIRSQPEQQTSVNGFAFTSTNFDDGWISSVQEDWVQVTKGNIKVLLHYPKEGTIFPADPAPLTNAAWNILVAPRYKNLQNYKTAYINTFDRPYLGMGNATENATGKNVFIVLFRQGHSGWIEFITPDKNTFIQQYKFDPETIQWDSESDLMIPLANMTGYNKFGIAASDLKGRWTSDFSGIQQMYNVYTGEYAGMNMNQSNEEFIFYADNTYNWKLLVVKGMIGNVKYDEVKSTGKITVPNNWQVNFSMIESRARTYHAFWSCIKGARILNLLDADSPGSGIYEKYGLAK